MFCSQHVDSGFGSVPDVDLSRHFGSEPLNFQSACDINSFLCALAKLMIEGQRRSVADRIHQRGGRAQIGSHDRCATEVVDAVQDCRGALQLHMRAHAAQLA